MVENILGRLSADLSLSASDRIAAKKVCLDMAELVCELRNTDSVYCDSFLSRLLGIVDCTEDSMRAFECFLSHGPDLSYRGGPTFLSKFLDISWKRHYLGCVRLILDALPETSWKDLEGSGYFPITFMFFESRGGYSGS